MNPIPSRTRPLNSSAPMVLWLKPWESRSLPGLPQTKQFLFTCHDQNKTPLPFGAQAKQAPPKQSAPPPAAEAPAVKQIALTEKQIQGVLAAQKDVDAITDKLPDNAKPDPKVDAQLDAVAKKNGFASYDEYNTVV